jgi:hypothetical protein
MLKRIPEYQPGIRFKLILNMRCFIYVVDFV